MKSIRSRLNLTIIGTLVVVLSLTAVFLYLRISQQVITVYDTSLLDKAKALISLTELDEEGLEFDFAEDGVMSEFELGPNPHYYQLWQLGTQLLIKSPSLSDSNLPLIGIGLERHHFADVKLPDGRAGRLIEINFMPRVEIDDEEGVVEIPEPKPISLVYARERRTLDDTLFAIGLTIFTIVIVVLMATSLLVWHLVGRGLLPLSTLARQVSEIDESSLSVRLSQQGEQSLEIKPIIDQLNNFLVRLQSAFEREKRFSSNVAHELRTPLSELKTLSEVGQMIPDDREQLTEFFRDVSEISNQMEKVVITLLELARSDAGLLNSDPQEILLSDFCDSVWQMAINEHEVSKNLVKHIPEGLIISTDREKFAMILSNIFVNAINYSPQEADIKLSVEIKNDHIVLRVKNVATDLRPEDIVHMKDRFWRKNKSQGKTSHSGLGLTLVYALARILKLDISLDLDSQSMFMVTISGVPLVLE
ncbi:MAG: sensor histidine kinase N-terminal domain-containing protein [Candidatus Thiodiazotropha sp. (ex Clathrolucina costata)]|nr:sensor histidine kinase N-terminal domain-containing protein [Candidatus Thiodiazotropha taylori]MBT3053208.1 sensor histidine kinase N-terminal domain-containing protein [Candidatus Thiodiazotropha sp. (ex Codakia orbicularis)]